MSTTVRPFGRMTGQSQAILPVGRIIVLLGLKKPSLYTAVTPVTLPEVLTLLTWQLSPGLPEVGNKTLSFDLVFCKEEEIVTVEHSGVKYIVDTRRISLPK